MDEKKTIHLGEGRVEMRRLPLPVYGWLGEVIDYGIEVPVRVHDLPEGTVLRNGESITFTTTETVR